jgi:hypothetical protein
VLLNLPGRELDVSDSDSIRAARAVVGGRRTTILHSCVRTFLPYGRLQRRTLLRCGWRDGAPSQGRLRRRSGSFSQRPESWSRRPGSRCTSCCSTSGWRSGCHRLAAGLIALSALLNRILLVLVLVVLLAVLIYSCGEIVLSAASWELGFELADPDRPVNLSPSSVPAAPLA